LQVTSRKDQAQYWADRQQAYQYVSVADFSEAFKRFYTGSQMFQELSVPYPKERSHKAALATETYAISTMELFKANFAKEVLLMRRNHFIYVFKTLQIILTALISITTFLRTRLQQHEVSDGVTYLGALFFAITTIMFNGFGDLAMTIARLPVVFKQRDLRFYPVWTYAISTFMLSLPISVIECMIWTGITYYVTGYAPEPGRFFRQFFLLVTVQQMTGGLFRFIGGMCRSMIKAHSVGFVTILLFFMLGGFIIPRPHIRVWWVWFYWISPLTYANQALSVNEFLAPRWNKVGVFLFTLQNAGNIGIDGWIFCVMIILM
jgi:ABC-type multidrug transport system permease subunit